MEFKQLEVYVKLVELKSFSDAAKALGISQPTVSVIIKNLENDLNSELITRSTREVEVTKKGEELFKRALSLLKQRDDIIYEFRGINNKKINIGASSIPSEFLLPDYLKDFKSKYKDTKTAVYESNSKTVIQKVKDYELDVGFVGMKDEIKNLKYIPIYKDKLVFIATNDKYHRDLIAQKPSVKRLLKEPLILREEGSGTNELFKKLLKKLDMDISDINISLRANRSELIKKMVKDNLGSAFVSKLSINHIQSDEFITYDIDIDTSRNFYLIYNKNYPKNSEIECFVEFIKDKINSIIFIRKGENNV